MTDRKGDDFLDLALEQTFPASDPPSYMAAASIVGAPAPDRIDPDNVKFAERTRTAPRRAKARA